MRPFACISKKKNDRQQVGVTGWNVFSQKHQNPLLLFFKAVENNTQFTHSIFLLTN